MNHWFTRPDAPIVSTHVKRFDPLHWTVDFPRGAMASIVTMPDGHGLSVKLSFLRKGDLVGLIFESEDKLAHPAHARETSRDYSNCVLRFRWQSSGLAALDVINGPTLTIEGCDAAGDPRFWYVRLWNYASGSPTDAVITLDFDALDGGFGLPADADRVDPSNIDRMFISLIPPGYEALSEVLWPAGTEASVKISDLSCDGAGSVLDLKDAVVAEHALRIATAYDDMYNLPPERIVQAIERLGHRGVINHYVGMSHYFALDGMGMVDPTRTTSRSLIPARILVGVDSGSVARSVTSPVSSRIHLIPVPRNAWRLTMFPNTYATSPPTKAPAVTIRKPTIDRAIGSVRSVPAPPRMTADTIRRTSATTMSVLCRVARVRAVPSVST